MRLQHFLTGRMTWASTCRRATCESFTPYVKRLIVVSPQRLVIEYHAVEDGSRLADIRVERSSGSVMERRA